MVEPMELTDEKKEYGSWADEMEDMPTIREYSFLVLFTLPLLRLLTYICSL